MVIFNIKLNKKSIFKTVIAIMLAVCITLCIVGAYMLFVNNNENELEEIGNCLPESQIAEISPENYTNILQAVHENIDTYIGQKISFTRICL